MKIGRGKGYGWGALLSMVLALEPGLAGAANIKGTPEGAKGPVLPASGLPAEATAGAGLEAGALAPLLEGQAVAPVPELRLPEASLGPVELHSLEPVTELPKLEAAGARETAQVPGRVLGQNNARQASESSSDSPAQLTLGREDEQRPSASRDVNAAAIEAADAIRPGAGLVDAVASVARVFEGGARPSRDPYAPVSAEEVFVAGVAAPMPERAAKLVAAADEISRARAGRSQSPAEGILGALGIPAAGGALAETDLAVLRGADDLARSVAITKTTPKELAAAEEILDSMDDRLVDALTARAERFLRNETPESTPFAVGPNWEHVERQHLLPLAEDAEQLAKAFSRRPGQTPGQFAKRIRLLMMVHDLGKVEIPADMKAALAKAFPDKDGMWYVNMFILPHEYASIHWIDRLGRQEGLSARQILSLQKLIANHNFGPELSDPRNAALRGHWWPSNFRAQTIPALAALGVPVGRLLAKDESGALQYNSSENGAYSALLSAYDRSLANKHTGYGMSAWVKFSNQDYQSWLKAADAARERNERRGEGELKESEPETTFNGRSLVARMESSAAWTAKEIDSLWRSLYEKHGPEAGWAFLGYPSWESFQEYPPFKSQREGARRLVDVIASVKRSNPDSDAQLVPQPGVAYYRTADGGRLYRVSLKSDRSVLVEERLGKAGWQAPRNSEFSAPRPNPIEAFFALVRSDTGL